MWGHVSEGGMMRLETLIQLKFLNSSFSSLSSLLKLNKQFPVEQFEAAVSQSAVPSPPPSSLVLMIILLLIRVLLIIVM